MNDADTAARLIFVPASRCADVCHARYPTHITACMAGVNGQATYSRTPPENSQKTGARSPPKFCRIFSSLLQS